MKLNVGAGRDIRPGWTNLDSVAGPGIDIVVNIGTECLPLDLFMYMSGSMESAFDEIECSHIVEHVDNLLYAAENLWFLAAPNCKLTVKCPHGASDDAWEDPTHRHALYPGSFRSWAQPYYWRADYGYRGDWRIESCTLLIDPALCELPSDEAFVIVQQQRNRVREIVTILRAVKPARPAKRELLEPLAVSLQPATQ